MDGSDVSSEPAERGYAGALEAVRSGLAQKRVIRCALPHDGRLCIERPLPHLLVHPRAREEVDKAADRLVTPLPPYVIAGSRHDGEPLDGFVASLVELLVERFGRVLVVELVEQRAPPGPSQKDATPAFRIVVEEGSSGSDVITELGERLEEIVVLGHESVVRLHHVPREDLSGMARRVSSAPELARCCLWVRLEVSPVYRDATMRRCYPLVLAELQAGLYHALLHALHRFAIRYSNMDPMRPRQLGRTTLERAAEEVDETLVEVSGRLAFLLNLTPSNLPETWRRFRETDYDEEPHFEYRPLMLDPLEVKRMLFAAPFDEVEDPVIARLLRSLVEEYDGLLGMLEVRGSQDFMRRSLRAFGSPSDDLVQLAERILERYDPNPGGSRRALEVDALELMRRVRASLEQYQERCADFPKAVEIRNDVAAGIMVHAGTILIHEDLQVSAVRAQALLAHEVDVHVVTYHNGLQQPLRVLGSGLAGYEATQEGLAVLAEYLVGGLTPQRFRVLAARVIAVRAVTEQASFVDVFRLLQREHGLWPRSAFDIAVRTFRGGGLTKDALYLQGLSQVIRHLRNDGDLLDLFAGKISLLQWQELEALRERGLVKPPAVTPLWLERRGVQQRLQRLRGGLSIFAMASHDESPPDSKRELS